MKDCFDMVTDIRSLINVPAITSLIDGKIYPNIRPDGSIKADVVVNALGITNTQDQIGSGNINVYVPRISSSGVQVIDQARISSICKAAAALIDEQYKPTFRVFLDGQPTLERDTDGNHYGNIRYKYYSIQDNYTNI